MEENPSVTPSPLAPHPHKEFFILGSIFTVLMLLVATGILYFQDNSLSQLSRPTFIVDYSGQQTRYSKDEKYVYFDNEVIPDADPVTFEIAEPLNFYDAQDKNFTYTKGESVQPVLDEKGNPNSWYTKSKRHVYFGGGTLIPEADPKTIETIGQYIFARDANNFYVRGEPTPRTEENDAFVYLGGVYYKDDKDVSWYSVDGSGIAEGADTATFKVLEQDGRGCYAKDSNHVFFCGDIVEDADSETFIIVTDPTLKTDAQDKNHKYLNGKVVE